jgi:hypothetical protein
MSRIGDWMQEPRATCAWPRRPTWWWWAAARPACRRPTPRRATAPSVTLLERYNHLGGLASGGMVLVLDDMWDATCRKSRCAAPAWK